MRNYIYTYFYEFIYTICQQCFRSVIIIPPTENKKVISILNIEKNNNIPEGRKNITHNQIYEKTIKKNEYFIQYETQGVFP